jgi:hypothetical protein
MQLAKVVRVLKDAVQMPRLLAATPVRGEGRPFALVS